MRKKKNRALMQRNLMGVLCLAAAVAFTVLTIVATLDFQKATKRQEAGTVAAAAETDPTTADVPAEKPLPTEDGVAEGSTGTPAFILRSYEGKIAVFRPDEVEPLEVLDIYVNHLPDLDIQRLEEGIPVTDQDELLRYLADFDS